MISTVHEATTVNTGWKDRKTNMEIKKPYAVFLVTSVNQWHIQCIPNFVSSTQM
jgi:hypothetical protein